MTAATAPTSLSRLLRLIGLVAVLFSSLHAHLWTHPWIAAGAVLSWIAWAAWAAEPQGTVWPGRICLCAMAIGGGSTAAWVAGSAITALGTVFAALSLATAPVTIGLAIATLSAVCTCISVLGVAGHPRDLLGLLVGVLVFGLMGWSRRQAREAADQNRLLLEQNRVIRAERDRAAALAERGRLARDIHDVLAHTLGGLVRQLDAADALLEAGEVDRASERVKASHELARSGFEDARRVVNALRAEGFDLGEELRRLAAEERASGGRAELRVDAELRRLDEQTAVAIGRAAQEACTNARKHAPGQPITLTLEDRDEGLDVTIGNPITGKLSALRDSGAGAGLLGMTERIAAVGGTVRAGRQDNLWTVRIRVPHR
ncbi:sensor histidine kinase [Nocardia macrotermitis]|uniref:histidine kinase n=1 Tax=Nocardia macrotermitis TaxID=2585198 RepID=A0A7K0D2H1_9NOCA|nr:histidine kinase [Nocardia macrotermitis]MQY19907.1 hypothetical protein [Nocardia macrotermitis]